MRLSVRKYAEHRGARPPRCARRSPPAASNAGGTTDAESADAAWGKNTDSAQQRVVAAPRRASDRAVPSATVASLRENGEADRMTFASPAAREQGLQPLGPGAAEACAHYLGRATAPRLWLSDSPMRAEDDAL
jgi:hypothetical protein